MSRAARAAAILHDGHLEVGAGDNPFAVYGTDTLTAAAVEVAGTASRTPATSCYLAPTTDGISSRSMTR